MAHFWRNIKEDFALAMKLTDLARKYEGSPKLPDILRAEVLRRTGAGKDDRLHVGHDDHSLAA